MSRKTKKSDRLIKCSVVEQIPVGKLKPHKANARKHSAEQVEKLAKSIDTFGFVCPIIVDPDNTIIAGHGRVEAAKLLGLESVPAIRAGHLSDAEIRAYMIADNKLTELAEWDKDILELELAELKALDLDFDLDVKGFDFDELDISFEADDKGRSEDQAEQVTREKARKKPAATNKTHPKRVLDGEDLSSVSSPSDLWILGSHRLICGRALRDNDVMRQLMQDKRAQMAFTSLPIEVRVEASQELGIAKRLYFEGVIGYLGSGELTSEVVTGLFRQVTYCDHGARQFIHVPALAFDEVLKACGHLYAVEEIRDFGGDLLLERDDFSLNRKWIP